LPLAGESIGGPMTEQVTPSRAGSQFSEQQRTLSPRTSGRTVQLQRAAPAARTSEIQLQPEASPEVAAPDTVEAFKNTVHAKERFNSPSTKMGLFDVSYDPRTARMTVTVKLAFQFITRATDDPSGPSETSAEWTEASKGKWERDFVRLVEGRWGGKHKFRCTQPGYEEIKAFVDVEVQSVKSDWHYQLSVTKIPEGAFQRSHVKSKRGNTSLNRNTSRLDSEDLAWRDKHGGSRDDAADGVEHSQEMQKGAVHEFGHMLGLDDEYSAGAAGIKHSSLVKSALGADIAESTSDDIMAYGNSIEKQHYVVFWEALRAVTEIDEWEFE